MVNAVKKAAKYKYQEIILDDLAKFIKIEFIKIEKDYVNTISFFRTSRASTPDRSNIPRLVLLDRKTFLNNPIISRYGEIMVIRDYIFISLWLPTGANVQWVPLANPNYLEEVSRVIREYISVIKCGEVG
jgi:hypothetical protein